MSEHYPKKHGFEGEVSLLDTFLGLHYPIGSLTIIRLCNPLLGGLSQLWLMLEPAMFNQLAPIVKLDGERCPIGINICAIEKPADVHQANINQLAAESNVIQRSMLGAGCPPV